MSRDSLIARIELIKKEIEALTKVLAQEYRDNVLGGVNNMEQYTAHKERLTELNSDLVAALDLLAIA